MGRPGSHKAEEYVRPPKQRGFRRDVQVYLEDERYDPVFRYALETAPDRPVQDAIRELLLLAVAADAKDASIRAGRMQAYREAHEHVISKLIRFLNQLRTELELDPVGSETQPQAGNTIAADAFPASKRAA